MSMFHGRAWRSTPARGKEGAPHRPALPQVSPPTGYVQAFAESPSPSRRLGQLQSRLGHRGLLPPPKGSSVHETGSSPRSLGLRVAAIAGPDQTGDRRRQETGRPITGSDQGNPPPMVGSPRGMNRRGARVRSRCNRRRFTWASGPGPSVGQGTDETAQATNRDCSRRSRGDRPAAPEAVRSPLVSQKHTGRRGCPRRLGRRIQRGPVLLSAGALPFPGREAEGGESGAEEEESGGFGDGCYVWNGQDAGEGVERQ